MFKEWYFNFILEVTHPILRKWHPCQFRQPIPAFLCRMGNVLVSSVLMITFYLMFFRHNTVKSSCFFLYYNFKICKTLLKRSAIRLLTKLAHNWPVFLILLSAKTYITCKKYRTKLAIFSVKRPLKS